MRPPALSLGLAFPIALTAIVFVANAAASSWNPSLLVNTEAFQVVDDSDVAANVSIKFGDTIAKNLTYDRSAQRFQFDDDLLVQGTFTATSTISGSALHVSTLTTSGGLLIGRGSQKNLGQAPQGSSGQLLLSQGGGTPIWRTPTSTMLWYIDGTLSVGTKKGVIVTMPFGLTLTALDLKANGAPTGSALIVDINEGGTTIFSTRPQIDGGATVEAGTHAFSDTVLAPGSEITIDIDQVGSTFAGSGLTILLHGTRRF